MVNRRVVHESTSSGGGGSRRGDDADPLAAAAHVLMLPSAPLALLRACSILLILTCCCCRCASTAALSLGGAGAGGGTAPPFPPPPSGRCRVSSGPGSTGGSAGTAVPSSPLHALPRGCETDRHYSRRRRTSIGAALDGSSWAPRIQRNVEQGKTGYRRRRRRRGDTRHGALFLSRGGGGGDVGDASSLNGSLSGGKGEVVGSTGRIGSLLLRSSTESTVQLLTTPGGGGGGGRLLAAVPRGVCPGSLSPPGAPIYVSVPAGAVGEVIASTLPERRGDLVLITNGLPSRLLGDLIVSNDGGGGGGGVTVAVPHFGVLSVNGPVVTSPSSPPTVVYGRHAQSLSDLLSSWDVNVERAASYRAVQVAAVRKLVWSSAMWLLCHDVDDGEEPLTVEEVHGSQSERLRSLVEELLPAADAIVAASTSTGGGGGGGDGDGCSIGSVDDVLEYMERYSLSMPGAVPNKQLAMDEIEGRNGVFLTATAGGAQQPLHEGLVRRVAGDDALRRCREAAAATPPPSLSSSTSSSSPSSSVRSVPHGSCTPELAFLVRSDSGDEQRRRRPIKSAIVIGAGIIGSSVALGLSRRGVDVTVFDKRPDVVAPATLPTAGGGQQEGGEELVDPGEATSASWAWINANGKSPPAYFALNNLGMTVWRRDPAIADLPVWCGSLVRRRRRRKADGVDDGSDDDGDGDVDPRQGGAYCAFGPLSRGEVSRLEPGAEFAVAEAAGEDESPSSSGGARNDRRGDEDDYVREQDEGEVFYFPDEGHVDPVAAVRALRRAASDLGARFVGGTDIVDVAIDDDGLSGRVVVHRVPGEVGEATSSSTTSADVIVVAGGVGASCPALGGLPMVNQPGAVAFANPGSTNRNPDGSCSVLGRILVDTINESHVLSRTDGSLVVGGGYLQVGGYAATEEEDVAAVEPEPDEPEVGEQLLAAAARVAPRAMEGASLARTKHGNRPIPQDGFPAVGFVRPGLYTVVTHSGITLGPLFGELVAGEIVDCIRYDVLKDFRPTRFKALGSCQRLY